MTARLAVLLLAAVLAGCGDQPTPRAQAPAPSATPAATATPAPSAAPAPPDHSAPLPAGAAALAADLETTARTLRAAIRDWRRDGDPGKGDAPPEVAVAAARVERIHRALATGRRPARATLARLRGRVRTEARDVIAARRAIGVLNAPRPGQERPRRRTGPPEPADVLWRYYREARARSGVSVTLLAAVNLIESDFGRIRNDSVAGAQGPMQFIPSTWASYGQGGDVHDPHDAILGAARFLAAAGAGSDEAGALYRYNPSSLYVSAVQRYARIMRRDPLAFYALYASGA